MASTMTFVDLFAGIGGFHQALKSIGGKCVFASEWDKYAAETYTKNYGIKPQGDITKIAAESIPKHDILCAGFPCQAFSICGKRKGFEDTRGTLFFDIARIARHHKPKLIILENVKNLKTHDKGKTLATMLSVLDELGYNVHYKVLNASHFGLPQSRIRIYFMCFRKDLKGEEYSFPIPMNKGLPLSDFLELNPSQAKIVNRPDTYINRTYEPPKNTKGEIEYPNRPILVGVIDKGCQGYRIYDPAGHAITLSAYGGGAGDKTGLYKVGNVIRKLSPRECARVQGFPDDFEIISPPSQAYKQFGNSVAVKVIKEIMVPALPILQM